MYSSCVNIIRQKWLINRSMDKEDRALRQLHVNRPLYEQDALNRAYHYEKPKSSFISDTKEVLTPDSCGSFITSMVPALSWLRTYKWRKNGTYDLISGLTVAIMHIPQGLAYALLGNVPPVVGIYMAFFPVLVYFFLGTSKHVSMGTFAIVCLMTGKAVQTHATLPDALGKFNETNGTTITGLSSEHYTPIEIATAITFMVGLIQLAMYLFRLGIISTLLSETLVNGFTTGAAVHVLMSQIQDLLGLRLHKGKSIFKLAATCIAIFEELPNINVTAAIVSTIAIIIMVFNNEILKPYFAKKCSIPIPIELIAVVTGTLVSEYGNLPGLYGIATVGNIPTGLPDAKLPRFSLLPSIALDSIAITMVSYTITMSMALIFAQKLNYEVDSNQELFAMGTSNIVGSFFSCMPVTASLSRSLIQQTTGGRSQLASIVSCGILLTILLWIGPFFEPLPRCILGAIIVVALKGMLFQAMELKRFWKLSKLDASVWIVTFFTVVIFNIDVGLVVGLLVSLASIFVQSIKPYTCLLGHIPNTDLYLDLNRFKGTTELCGIKIFHYCGGLNFANSGHLKSELFRLVGIIPRQVIEERKKLAKRGLYPDQHGSDEKEVLRCIIIDLSALSYVDPTGINTLKFLASEFEKIEVPIYLAGCSGPVFEQIVKCDLLDKTNPRFKIFAAVHDAVSFTQHELFK
ncbi:solute carrier family 26 member 6-like isoform X2 [Athalia rosae]|uniref:solute carrier family 26 member 6-like isoform X2 n=1 Tax=Athalia rosae TaxID=37344 RepID=UPI00203379A5|nr:solute carrier family 26 member 6-like isoform X2 [Athalia rosae]